MLFKSLVAFLAVASFVAALPLSPAMRHRELLDIIERTPKKQGWTSGPNAFKRHLNIEDIKRSREQAIHEAERAGVLDIFDSLTRKHNSDAER